VLLDINTHRESVSSLFANQENVNRATFGHPISVVTLWSAIHMGTKNGVFSDGVGLEDTIIDLGDNATISKDTTYNPLTDPDLLFQNINGVPAPKPVPLKLRTWNRPSLLAVGCDCRANWLCAADPIISRNYLSKACDGMTETFTHRLKSWLSLQAPPVANLNACCAAYQAGSPTASATCLAMMPLGLPYPDTMTACYFRDIFAAALAATQDSINDGVPVAMLQSSVTTIDHQAYFQACAPVKCTYEDIRTKSGADVLTAVLGIVGGGNTFLSAFYGKLAVYFAKRGKAGAV